MTRIVIENAHGLERTAQAATFEDAGYDVSVCGGPAASGESGCPLVSSGSCPLIDGADLVFFDLDLDRVENREVLRHLRMQHRETPVVVEVPAETARRYHALLEGCEVVLPFDADKLLAAVDRVADQALSPFSAAPTT